MTGRQGSARANYAGRALLELSAATPGERLTRDELAQAQDIPRRYLEAILIDLRQAGLVTGLRGPSGGYLIGRAPDAITVGEVVRTVDGPLSLVQGERPENVRYAGASEHLVELWVGLRAAVRSVLDDVTLADLLAGRLPQRVQDLIATPEAWQPR